MPKISVLNVNGEKVKDIKLNDNIWSIEPNDAVIYDAIRLATASLRQGTHSVKTRAEVSGGGRKPWRQKGTGNARQGSTRSPQWRHGGIVFGCLIEDLIITKEFFGPGIFPFTKITFSSKSTAIISRF